MTTWEAWLGTVCLEQWKRKELLEVEVGAHMLLDRDLHVWRRSLANSKCVPTTGLADAAQVSCDVRQEGGENLCTPSTMSGIGWSSPGASKRAPSSSESQLIGIGPPRPHLHSRSRTSPHTFDTERCPLIVSQGVGDVPLQIMTIRRTHLPDSMYHVFEDLCVCISLMFLHLC